MIKVGVIGARGRMGSETCAAIDGAEDLELVARVGSKDDVGSMSASGAQVAVEFSTPSSVAANVHSCIEQGIHTVVGATGLDERAVESIDRAARSAEVGVLIAPNFALGAVLMMRFAAQAASFYEWAQIVERHHEKKLDAPSGTAARTARMMADARGKPFSTGGRNETVEGSLGGEISGIGIHSLRLPGSVAHQEVILGAPGETLTIRHDSLDRASFMPGVLHAIRKVGELRGATVGLEKILPTP